MAYVHALDDDASQGPLDFAMFPATDLSMFAEFNPSLAGKEFPEDRRFRLSGYLGNLPGNQARMVIVRTGNGYFANGTGLQPERVVLPCDIRDDNRWTLDITLPRGNYEAYLRGVVPDNQQFQAQPSVLTLRVR